MTTPHLKKSIGSSSSRLALLLIALVFACLGIRQSAQAGYIVTLRKSGPMSSRPEVEPLTCAD